MTPSHRVAPRATPAAAAPSSCPDADGVFTPELVGTAAVPPSESNQVALLADERVACVFDFYETRVRCMDTEGAVVGVFGRQGEGPGEFGSSESPNSLDLVRGEDGTLGVYDSRLFRFTVFEPSGAYVADARMPFLQPRRSFGTVLTGTVWRGWIADSLMVRYDVNVASGEVMRQEASPSGPWGADCGEEEGIDGIPDRAEGWVFVACRDRLIFVDNTGNATVLSVPTELPDERDVARREEAMWIGWEDHSGDHDGSGSDGQGSPNEFGRYLPIGRRPDSGTLSIQAQALLPGRGTPVGGRRQPLLDRHAARHSRMVLPGRVRECGIRRVGEGQGPAEGLRRLRVGRWWSWSSGRSAPTTPTGSRTGHWTGTICELRLVGLSMKIRLSPAAGRARSGGHVAREGRSDLG